MRSTTDDTTGIRLDRIAFTDYVGIKLHFREVGFHYNLSKEKFISLNALQSRRDSHFFEKLVFEHKRRERWQAFLISCFLKNQSAWIGEVFDEEYEDFHQERVGRLVKLPIEFETQMSSINEWVVDHKPTPKQFFNDLYDLSRRKAFGQIYFETLAVINSFFKFAGRVKTEDPLISKRLFVMNKYSGVLQAPKNAEDHMKTLLTNLSGERHINQGESNVICST